MFPLEKIYAQGAAAVKQITVSRPTNVYIQDVGKLISAIVSFLLIISALAAFLFLILGGIQWITSGGDKAGMESARNKITQAIVGLVIVAAAYAIMLLVTNFLGLDLSNLNIQRPFDN